MAKVAILGWGSLVWDPRELPREGTWHTEGPRVPLEFSRVSGDGRLTLVIDETDGELCISQFVLSPRPEIEDAICDLRHREGTTDENIGFVDLQSNTERARSSTRTGLIKTWAQAKELDGVIWTDLPPNFKDRVGVPYSVANAVAYLRGLRGACLEIALRYIEKAPGEVTTPLRRHLERLGNSPTAVRAASDTSVHPSQRIAIGSGQLGSEPIK